MGQEHTPAIEIEDLHKSFGSQTVLDGVDLKIECGETLSVLGPSGTGKSVLLKLIIGLQKADAGSIKVNGKRLHNFSREAKSGEKGDRFPVPVGRPYDSERGGEWPFLCANTLGCLTLNRTSESASFDCGGIGNKVSSCHHSFPEE
jgi:ABC-type arginine transport system ATPase subunit